MVHPISRQEEICSQNMTLIDLTLIDLSLVIPRASSTFLLQLARVLLLAEICTGLLIGTEK